MATGRLFVVATPIGNLDDISARALQTLRSVSLIAAEDTRHSRRLLDHFQIATPLTSYHEHNEVEKTDSLLSLLAQGRDIALITDAGTPCISDPGYRIVRAAQEQSYRVIAIPGVSAVIAALSISGLPSDRFSFFGFFPRKAKEAGELLARARQIRGTHIFYEAPSRLCDTLRCLLEELPDAVVCVARELTKIHEETVRGTPEVVLKHYEEFPPKGECVVLVHIPDTPAVAVSDEAIRKALRACVDNLGMSRRDAVRHVVQTLAVPRNRVYDLAGEV